MRNLCAIRTKQHQKEDDLSIAWLARSLSGLNNSLYITNRIAEEILEHHLSLRV